MLYTLTKIDIAALREANRIVISYNESSDQYRKTGVRLIRDAKKTEKTPFAEDVEHTFEACPVSVARHGLDVTGVTAFAHIYFYPSQHTPESTIAAMLRAGDQIEFRFMPDEHTNGYVAAAGLHADVLLLCVVRGKQRLTFEIESCVSPNNQARMIRGIPDSRSYRENGARCRAENWTPPATL